MTELAVVGGEHGRLYRRDNLVAYVTGADSDLLSIFSDEMDLSLFKTLAAHVVAREFEAPPFIAIDLGRQALFLFGDLTISLDAGKVSGADSATWIEQSTASTELLSYGVDQPASVDESHLHRGCVPAAGFLLRTATGVTKSQSVQTNEAQHLTTEKSPPRSEPSDETTNEMPDVLTDPGIDLASLGSSIAVPANDALIPPLHEPDHVESDSDTIDVVQDDDRESDVRGDLHEPQPQSESTPAPGVSDLRRRPPTPGLARGSLSLDSDTPVQQPRAALKPNADPTEKYSNDGAESDALFAQISLEDGSECRFNTGVLVGRFPSKRGVPDGYETLESMGKEVSRVHLELRVADGQLIARDCETPNGSVLRRKNGNHDLSADEGDALMPGDSINFGTQTLTFHGWTGHA